jgi:hypothetical protein
LTAPSQTISSRRIGSQAEPAKLVTFQRLFAVQSIGHDRQILQVCHTSLPNRFAAFDPTNPQNPTGESLNWKNSDALLRAVKKLSRS